MPPRGAGETPTAHPHAVRDVTPKGRHGPRFTALAPALLLAAACATSEPAPPSSPVQAPVPTESATQPTSGVEVVLVQLNDVYEITSVGRQGGPARVATLLRRLEQETPATFAFLAGDFFSPSALGTARVDGERLAGRQMVAVLNTMGLDYATFGNHEFDIDEEAFRDRLAESRFRWVSSNVRDGAGAPLPSVLPHAVIRAEGPGGPARIGVLAVTFAGEYPEYVTVADPFAAARQTAALLRDSADVLVALTHLTLEQDVRLAEEIPDLDLVLGGHEHDNVLVRRGSGRTAIAKADANARTVWVHRLRIHPDSDSTALDSRLVDVTEALPEDPETAAAAARWTEIGFSGFRQDGFEPDGVVTELRQPLDGLESSVRHRPTPLTELILAGMSREAPGSHGVLLNAGSIRVDDVLTPGPLTQYDVIRVLPFGGPVLDVELRGDVLQRVLDQGLANRGGGGFLQVAGFARGETGWEQSDGTAVDEHATYRLAVADFLLSGREQGLSWLTPDHPGVTVLATGRDIRWAVIDELRGVSPN